MTVDAPETASTAPRHAAAPAAQRKMMAIKLDEASTTATVGRATGRICKAPASNKEGILKIFNVLLYMIGLVLIVLCRLTYTAG